MKFDGYKFFRYSSNTIMAQAAILLLSFLSTIITARILGPADKGKLTLLLLVPLMTVSFGRMGIGHAINYYAGKVSVQKLITNTLIVCFSLGGILFFAASAVVYLIRDFFFKGISNHELFAITLTIPLYIFYAYLPPLMQGLYKIRRQNFILLVFSLAYVFFLIVLLMFLKLHLKGAIIAWIIALFIMTITGFISIFKEKGISLKEFDRGFIKQLLFFGTKAHFGNVLKDLAYRGDMFLVGYFLVSSFVGYYSIAVGLAEAIWILPEALGNVLLPNVSRSTHEKSKIITAKVSRVSFFFCFLACLILAPLSRWVVVLFFGQEFSPAASCLRFLLPGILALSVWKVLSNDLIGRGHPLKYSFTSLLALVIMIFLDILLIPRFGINGAAIASSISYMSAAAAIVYIHLKLTGNSLKILLIPVKEDFISLKKYLNLSKHV